MRGLLPSISAAARVVGLVAVAAAIVATAVHFRHDEGRPDKRGGSAATPEPSDPLAGELARCRAIGVAAKDDPGCEAAWGENRRRFFTYRTSPDHAGTTTAASPNVAIPKSEGN